MNYLEKVFFKEINLKDSFFNSLKADYPGFEDWFQRKEAEEAYIIREHENIQGFLYLKEEAGPIFDLNPILNCSKALKIGTFKINPHGTRLGERFIKKALDYAISLNVDNCYVTIFKKHEALVKLFMKYGFFYHGTKEGTNGKEIVLVKDLKKTQHELLHDYPLIKTEGKNKFLLSIYPNYHSIMFPDSILNNEKVDILEDVTHTNSIHKTYVTRMAVNVALPGDIFVIYRTKSEGKSAEYTSVATSVCVVEEVKSQYEFNNFNDFYSYATTYSVFDKDDLEYWYNRGKCFTIKMTYNAALSKRLIRKKLIEVVGINRDAYWGFIKLTDEQFIRILEEGGVNEGIVID
jgi:hypothetical protein